MMKRKKKRHLRLSVSTIVAIKFDPTRVLYRSYSAGMSEGTRLHLEMGFTNKRSFSKVVDDIVVSGIPDRITNGVIEDLKTYYSEESRDFYEAMAHCQCNIYCFLAGLKKYKIYMYHVPSGKMTEIERLADYDQALKDIRKAVKVWKKLHEVLGIR